MTASESLKKRAAALSLHGLCAHLSQVEHEPWVASLLDWEESERASRGLPALFTTASALLADLSERHTSYALQQRLRHYARPKLLCIDEIGYLSYDARAADLLFEVITRR